MARAPDPPGPAPSTAPDAVPLREADPHDDYRVRDAAEVLALLRRITEARAALTLSGPDGVAVAATLQGVDGAHRRLSLQVEAADPSLAALVDGDEATAVVYLESVKLQFDLRGLVLVHRGQAAALQAELPRRVYRFQRRETFRVRTPEHANPTARLRHPAMPEMQLALRIIDISAGGCALLLPDDVPPLEPGCLLHGVRLMLDSTTRLDASLLLQHVASLFGGGGGLRLGCELQALTPADQRALQRFIDQTQRLQRAVPAPR